MRGRRLRVSERRNPPLGLRSALGSRPFGTRALRHHFSEKASFLDVNCYTAMVRDSREKKRLSWFSTERGVYAPLAQVKGVLVAGATTMVGMHPNTYFLF